VAKKAIAKRLILENYNTELQEAVVRGKERNLRKGRNLSKEDICVYNHDSLLEQAL
jgi:hypothetical protein